MKNKTPLHYICLLQLIFFSHESKNIKKLTDVYLGLTYFYSEERFKLTYVQFIKQVKESQHYINISINLSASLIFEFNRFSLTLANMYQEQYPQARIVDTDCIDLRHLRP